MPTKKKTSFSLLELIIVMVIIGILSTLSVRQYNTSREKALAYEAKSNLKLVAAAEKVYRLEMDFFFPFSTTSWSLNEINTNLKLSLTERNWSWSISGSGSTSFTTTADRVSGGYLDCNYQITNASSDASVVDPSKCP